MKRQYTKKQIQEAIDYWKKRLEEAETIGATYRTDRLIARKKEISDMLYHLRNFCSSVQEAYSLEKDVEGAGMRLEHMMEELGGYIDWKLGRPRVTLHVHDL